MKTRRYRLPAILPMLLVLMLCGACRQRFQGDASARLWSSPVGAGSHSLQNNAAPSRIVVEGADEPEHRPPENLHHADRHTQETWIYPIAKVASRFPPILPPADSPSPTGCGAGAIEPTWFEAEQASFDAEPIDLRQSKPSRSWLASPNAEEAKLPPLWAPGDLLADDPTSQPQVFDRRAMLANEYGSRMRSRAGCFLRNAWSDHLEYYSWPCMRDLLLGVAAGSVFANTSWDEDIRVWYQNDVRSHGTDKWSEFWKTFGEGEIFIPAFAGLAVAGSLLDRSPICFAAGDYGSRVTRGYLVGAPPMLFMQAFLGASRPGETRFESQWKPFDDTNAVSGHAFMGAVPFITAAKMVDPWWAKGGFYALSTFTAWSRVNDDQHYFSQACLGWWMAYLACSAVDRTENGCDRCYSLVPLTTPEICGVGLVYRR